MYEIGILRDHGLTSLLQSAGLDQEICNMLVSRAQWLSEHYVCRLFYSCEFNRVRCV